MTVYMYCNVSDNEYEIAVYWQQEWVNMLAPVTLPVMGHIQLWEHKLKLDETTIIPSYTGDGYILFTMNVAIWCKQIRHATVNVTVWCK